MIDWMGAAPGIGMVTGPMLVLGQNTMSRAVRACLGLQKPVHAVRYCTWIAPCVAVVSSLQS